jgi:hypothetical protein
VFDACSGFGFDSFEARDFLQAVPSMSPLFLRFTWLESMTRNNVIGWHIRMNLIKRSNNLSVYKHDIRITIVNLVIPQTLFTNFTILNFRFPLRKISMGSDRNKIEPAHGLSVSIFSSSLKLRYAIRMIKSWSIFNFFDTAVWIIQDGKKSSPVRSDGYFPQWKLETFTFIKYKMKQCVYQVPYLWRSCDWRKCSIPLSPISHARPYWH